MASEMSYKFDIKRISSLSFSTIIGIWALNQNIAISSFRTRDGIEVDFIAETKNGPIAIEVKTNDSITSEDCEGLIHFGKLSSKHGGLFIYHMGTKEKKWDPYGPCLGKKASEKLAFRSRNPSSNCKGFYLL